MTQGIKTRPGNPADNFETVRKPGEGGTNATGYKLPELKDIILEAGPSGERPAEPRNFSDDLNRSRPPDIMTDGTGKITFKSGVNGVEDHLINVQEVVWKKGKGIVGGHNLDSFESVFKSNNWNMDEFVISKTKHPTIDGIYEIEYQLPAKNAAQDIVEGQYKKIPMPKTVYDPAVISDAQMLEWGKEAMSNGAINGRVVTGTASNGLNFTGFIDEVTGEITNFYPTLK